LVLGKVVVNVKNWRLVCKDAHTSLLDQNLMLLEKTRGELLRNSLEMKTMDADLFSASNPSEMDALQIETYRRLLMTLFSGI
jgi:hypothetical protein